jgi:hypothetical protein
VVQPPVQEMDKFLQAIMCARTRAGVWLGKLEWWGMGGWVVVGGWMGGWRGKISNFQG